MILYRVDRRFLSETMQPYLNKLYKCLLSFGYYGMMRISELTGIHAIKAKDVHVSEGKEKILIILYTSKTHGKNKKPQEIKIERNGKTARKTNFSPFEIAQDFAQVRGGYYEDNEHFFVFRDRSPVTSWNVRKILRSCLKELGLNASLYNTHSLRSGRATDLSKYNIPIQRIKQWGRWRSNAVYNYIYE